MRVGGLDDPGLAEEARVVGDAVVDPVGVPEVLQGLFFLLLTPW